MKTRGLDSRGRKLELGYMICEDHKSMSGKATKKRRNEDHDKILQNTAPVCGKAGIDLLDVGKKVRNPSAHADERNDAEKPVSYTHLTLPTIA